MRKRYVIATLFGIWLLIFGIARESSDAIELGGDQVIIVNHGYHTGLYISLDALMKSKNPRAQILAKRYADATYLEFGWGDRGFYMGMGGIENLEIPMALRAFFTPTNSVMQIVPYGEEVNWIFSENRFIALPLEQGRYQLLIDEAVSGFADMAPIAPSLYGAGHFYEGRGTYSIFQTCNHWAARVLRAAGIASSYAMSFHSWTQMRELKWRYG